MVMVTIELDLRNFTITITDRLMPSKYTHKGDTTVTLLRQEILSIYAKYFMEPNIRRGVFISETLLPMDKIFSEEIVSSHNEAG